jgi:hypothetical protein
MLKKYSRVFVSSRLYPQSDVVGYDGKMGLVRKDRVLSRGSGSTPTVLIPCHRNHCHIAMFNLCFIPLLKEMLVFTST